MKENLSIELLGKRMRRIREQINLTREQFAEKVGISPQFLAEIENGKKGMSAETLFKICTCFDLSADYILLGKCSDSHLSDPVQRAFNSFSPLYRELAEEIIRAIEEMAEKEK